jgi:hypothetical protein
MLSLRTGSLNRPSLPPMLLVASSCKGSLSHSGGRNLPSAWLVVQSGAHSLPFAPGRRNEEVNCMGNASAFGHQDSAPGDRSGKSRQSEWRS